VSTVERPARTTASLAALVRDRARDDPDRVAVRSKRLGIWREVTWAQYWHEIQQAAQVLLHLGVAPGDRVAIVSENRYEWLVVDAATVALRGVTVGIDPTATPAQVGTALADARAVVVIAENQEQVDKILAVGERVPDLAHLLYLDARGLGDGYADARPRSWSSALEQRSIAAEDVWRRMDEAEPDDAVALFQAAASAVTLSSRDVARDVEAVMDGGIAPAPSDRDLTLPFTGLADRTERLFSSWLNAAAGVQLHFAESVSTVPRDLREVQPTLAFAPARVWELLTADIERRMAGATRLKRLVWRVWRPVALRVGTHRVGAGRRPPVATRALWAVGRLVLYRPLRDRIGMRRVRHAATDGSVPADVLAFFAGIGVPLRVRASDSEPAGGDVGVRTSDSEPAGGDAGVRASDSEPAGGDAGVR
jgi:long-chain acyl-CoA synthetase